MLAAKDAYAFACFFYPTSGLQWTRSGLVNVGFDAGDFQNFYSLPNAFTESITSLTAGTNSAERGTWCFQVGGQGSEMLLYQVRLYKENNALLILEPHVQKHFSSATAHKPLIAPLSPQPTTFQSIHPSKPPD